MRILLATYGTRGDVEPLAALALQLQQLGADVRMCAPADNEFTELLERVGVAHIPFRKTWASWASEAATSEERVMDVDEFVSGYIGATYETLLNAARGSDMFLATGMLHFVAQSVAEKLSIPHRFALFSPGLEVEVPARDALIAGPLNAHRASIDLPAVDNVRDFLFTRQPWIAAGESLTPRDGRIESDVVQTPPWVLADDRPLPRDLLVFLDAGTPPVYVGFGSMRVPQDTANAAIEAIRTQGRRVVLARGQAGLVATDDKDDCFVAGEVNQQALFPRVAAVIHHGGAGTTTTAARAGAAQVVVPQAADQSDWAQRVTALGIGAGHEGSTPTANSLSAPLVSALSLDTRARAISFAGKLRTDGAAAAARMLVEQARKS